MVYGFGLWVWELSGDQNPPYSKKKGAFRNKVWRKQSAVFRNGS